MEDVEARARNVRPSWLSPPSADRGPLARLHHCWVADDVHGQVPGLLLEWQRAGEGWAGRVVRPAYDEQLGEWRPVEEWLPAERLRERS